MARSGEVADHMGYLKSVHERVARLPWARVPDPRLHPVWEVELEHYDDGAY